MGRRTYTGRFRKGLERKAKKSVEIMAKSIPKSPSEKIGWNLRHIRNFIVPGSEMDIIMIDDLVNGRGEGRKDAAAYFIYKSAAYGFGAYTIYQFLEGLIS